MTISNIVLADAVATPVTHTFVPVGRDGEGRIWFEDQSLPSPIGYWRISYQIVRPAPAGSGASSKTDRVYRVKVTLNEPVLETLGTNDAGITPAPTVSYIQRSQTEYILPERGLLIDRKNIRKMNWNLMNEPQLVALVENLIEPVG